MQTTFIQRIILFFFGILLSLIILEMGLRAASFLLFYLQEHKNQLVLKEKGSYRIMCIGESTTQGQYPLFLGEMLNRNVWGVKFSVIDKGVGGTDTNLILAALEGNIRQYRPQMVVAMIGVNDDARHMPVEVGVASKAINFLKLLRVYKLYKLLVLHLERKWDEFGQRDKREPFVEAVPDFERHLELGRFYKSRGEKDRAIEAFRQACMLDVKNFELCQDLLWTQGVNKKKSRAMIEIVESALIEAMNINPNDKEVWHNYFLLGRFKLYEYQDFDGAAHIFKRLIAVAPERAGSYMMLGKCYEFQKQYAIAEEMYKKALKIDEHNPEVLNYFSVYYHQIGKDGLAEEYARKARVVAPSLYNPVTIENYKKIKKMLDLWGIRLVSVQYPLRSIKPLKEIFPGEKDIVFVDNEQVFKDALKNRSYYDIFEDMFSGVGDFGHCTDWGNKLLAENIARAILDSDFKN